MKISRTAKIAILSGILYSLNPLTLNDAKINKQVTPSIQYSLNPLLLNDTKINKQFTRPIQVSKEIFKMKAIQFLEEDTQLIRHTIEEKLGVSLLPCKVDIGERDDCEVMCYNSNEQKILVNSSGLKKFKYLRQSEVKGGAPMYSHMSIEAYIAHEYGHQFFFDTVRFVQNSKFIEYCFPNPDYEGCHEGFVGINCFEDHSENCSGYIGLKMHKKIARGLFKIWSKRFDIIQEGVAEYFRAKAFDLNPIEYKLPDSEHTLEELMKDKSYPDFYGYQIVKPILDNLGVKAGIIAILTNPPITDYEFKHIKKYQERIIQQK